jgi:hypothetical protein
MKVEGYVFGFFMPFYTIATIVYWFTSKDPMGTAAMGIAAGLGALVGGYLLITAKRTGPRPSDLPDAEIADGAGELGHFSPGSYWPFFISFFTAISLLGPVFGLWLSLIGAIGALATIVGLLFEHYVTRLAIEQD